VSRTFEGRDRFAPAAAWLANGIDISALGDALTAWRLLDVPEPAIDGARLLAQVVRVDRFGNLITNVSRPTFERFTAGTGVEIAAGANAFPALVDCYADVEPGALCALFGSSDHLEIAVNGGSAAERLGVGRGAQIVVRFP
jgi:S-adenosylmethionine hydrolase